MRFLCALALAVLTSGCDESASTCRGQHVPDAAIHTCGPGPSCEPCWSCQDFGDSPGWKILPGMCFDAAISPDAT